MFFSKPEKWSQHWIDGRWVGEEELSQPLAHDLDNAIAAIAFVAEGKEIFGDEGSRSFFSQMVAMHVPIVRETTPFPGFPYFEALLAIIPVGAVAAKLLHGLALEWLKTNREREIEIRLPDGTMMRLKGRDATPEKVERLLSRISDNKSRLIT